MQTLTKSITAGELSDALGKVPRHTPVAINVSISIAEACAEEQTVFQDTLPVLNIRTHVNCVELEARA